MSLEKTLNILRNPTTSEPPTELVPIFIGVAIELLQVTTTDGEITFTIPTSEAGSIFQRDLCEADVTYWKWCGTYTPTTVSTDLSTIELALDSEDEIPDLRRNQYSCFFVSTLGNGDTIGYTASLTGCKYSHTGATKTLDSITIDPPISATVYAGIDDYRVVLARKETVTIADASLFSQTYNAITINMSAYPAVSLSNLQTYIKVVSRYYYKAIDWRILEILPNATLPNWLCVNEHNQLGQMVAQHRLMSDNKLVVYTIPDNTSQNTASALSAIAEGDNAGYYIVPATTDEAFGPIAKTWLDTQQEEYSYFTTILSTSLSLFKPLGQGSITYSGAQ